MKLGMKLAAAFATATAATVRGDKVVNVVNVTETERPGTSGTSVIILCVIAVFSLTFLVCSCWFALKAAKENTSTVETVAVAHPIVGDRGADETITVAQPRLTREEREDIYAKRALMFSSMEESVTLDPFALFSKGAQGPKAPKEPKATN